MDWSCALCQVSTTSKRDLDEHLHGKKHKARKKDYLEMRRCAVTPLQKTLLSRDSAGQEIKATLEEESVKPNKNVVDLDQKVDCGQDEHLKRS